MIACGLPDVQHDLDRRERARSPARPRSRRGRRARRAVLLAQARGAALLRGPRPAPAARLAAARHRHSNASRRAERAPRRARPSPPQRCPRERHEIPGEPRGHGRARACSAPTCGRCASASRPGSRCRRPAAQRYRELSELIRSENLHTVCQEAACPNVGECWERGTATFMILGDTCTRRCGFCNVKTGKPTWNDPLEPARVARSIARMGLRHAVITSVDRDDLPDKGAAPSSASSARSAARRPAARSRYSRPTSRARRCRSPR